jgi:hypothetical protein
MKLPAWIPHYLSWIEQQTTNLGVGSSNLSGRARSQIKVRTICTPEKVPCRMKLSAWHPHGEAPRDTIRAHFSILGFAGGLAVVQFTRKPRSVPYRVGAEARISFVMMGSGVRIPLAAPSIPLMMHGFYVHHPSSHSRLDGGSHPGPHTGPTLKGWRSLMLHPAAFPPRRLQLVLQQRGSEGTPSRLDSWLLSS